MASDFSYLNQIEPLKGNLIKGLQLIQQKEGFISDEALTLCGDYFLVPAVEAEGVISFYSQFKRVKPGKYQVSICDGTACHIKGTSLIMDWIHDDLKIKDGETDDKGIFSLETVACLGCCSLAPVMSINGEVFGNLDRKRTLKILKGFKLQEE